MQVTTIMDIKLAQELSSVYQDLLLVVFLDLKSMHDNLYWGIILQKLAGYRAGPKIWGLLAESWSQQEVFTCQNSFHEPQFLLTRGTTQGGLASPTLLNVAVDSVVTNWLSLTVEDNSATHVKLGVAVGRYMGAFYVDDGMIVIRHS